MLTLSLLSRKSPSLFFTLVPTDQSGSRLLHVSMFSKDPTIFYQTIGNMQWSLPASYVNAQRADNPPPDKFSCVFVHADTDYRTEIVVSDTTTGRELKEKICTSFFYHVSVHAPNDDPSLPAIVSDKWLDLHVEIAGSPGHSRGLKCKLLDAWPLRSALLGLTDDTFFHDSVTIIYAIRGEIHPTSMFESLLQCLH